MSKTCVIIFYGGRSTEHEIACKSALNFFKNLDRQKFQVAALGIDYSGQWYLQDEKELQTNKNPALPIHKHTPIDASINALLSELQRGGYEVSLDSLVVIPSLHGSFGEDGTMQGFLELAEVAYVGPSTLASAICMDKEVTKNLVSAAGIAVVPFMCVRDFEWNKNQKAIMADAEKKLGLPLFVKPTNAGSAVGVHKVKSMSDLASACEDAFRYDDKILIEKGMDAREIEFAVRGNYEPIVSTPGEVTFGDEFFNYKEKYLSNSTQEFLVPAPLTAEKKAEGVELTKIVYRALQLHGMSRIDWFLCRKTDKFFLNEVNTIPGFTEVSGVPTLWKHDGVSVKDALNELVAWAQERKATKAKLARQYVD